MTHIPSASSFVLSILITATPIMAQAPQRTPVADSTGASKQSLSLAERGKGKEALQLLKKTPPAGSKELRLKAGGATVSCARNPQHTRAAGAGRCAPKRETSHRR